MVPARKIIRSSATWTLTVVVGGIVSGVVGQWFIQVGTDKGIYKHAGRQWDYATSEVLSALHSPLLYFAAAILGGLVAGMWLDKLLASAEGTGARLRRPRQDWSVVYRKVRAMQKRLKECEEGCENPVPADLPYEILSLHTSLRELGISTPNHNQRTWPPEEYYQSNWTFLACIAPFMRDKHKRETRVSAKRHLASIQPRVAAPDSP